MELHLFLFFLFQGISVARPRKSRAQIYSVFPPVNVAMATTTVVMKPTKGIVVSEVACVSSMPLLVDNRTSRFL